jgi:RHS repeat-associated protein
LGRISLIALAIRLGFGRVIPYNVEYSGSIPFRAKYMFVEPDGTRHYLAQSGWEGYAPISGETSDGSRIKFSGTINGILVQYKNGTTVYYSVNNNRLLADWIQDSNGNYITVAYASSGSPLAIDYITDTLGRIIQFSYHSGGKLIGITAPGFDGKIEDPVTRTLAQFDYQSLTVTNSFSGLTVENAPGTIQALRHIYYPANNTGYLLSSSVYGMVYNCSMRRAMSINGSVITDGTESASVNLNYPATASSLTDAPAFTQRVESAVSSPTATYTYSTSTDTFAQTMTFTVTQPDSTTLLLTRSTNSAIPANGRLVQSEIKIGSTSLGKSVFNYVNDPGGSPQVQSVTSYDDAGSAVKADFDYDAYGNVTNKREYGFQIIGNWQVRRRAHFTYETGSAYVSIGLRGLVTLVETFDALQNTNDADDVVIAKTSYAYDNYMAMGGMEDYGGDANPPGHPVAYSTSYTTRGNVTGVTEWTDLQAGTTIQHLAKIDIFGNVVKAQISCCQEKDLTNSDATFWSQPDSEMSGDPNGDHTTTSTDYDFNTSLAKSQINEAGLETSFGYDAALSPTSINLPTGASANSDYNYDNLSSTSTVTYDDLGTSRTITSTTHYDGWGRVIDTVAPNNAQVNTSYDAMGRVTSSTNPFTAGGSPGPATTAQYDLANRAVITTLPDGNTSRSDYSGSAVTVTDQVSRKIKRETDGLGRLVKVTEHDATGALAQDTNYSYSLLDKLTLVNQGNQGRAYKYDAIGRLLYEKIPEQTATINDGTGTYWTSAYAYTEYSALKKKTDARGVESHYAYDALHQVTSIWYTGVGGDDAGNVRPGLPSGVAGTGDLLYGYTAWGALSSVTIPSQYSETYAFDEFSRPTSVTRWLGQVYTGYKTYTTSYEYNQGSQVTKMIYPSGQQVEVNHDDKGRLQSLSSYLTGISYNISGQVTSSTLGNGVVESYGYDANRLQLTSQTATKSGNSLMNLTYNYQASAGQMGQGSTAGNAGQLMSISGTINGTTESANYNYDLLGRLATSSQTSNGASAQRRLDYDRWGNRTGVWDAVSGGSQIQSVTLQQSGGAPTNKIQTVYPPRMNYARGSNGGTASASSTNGPTYPASAAINRERKGSGWGEAGAGWMDGTSNSYPDWIQVSFNGSKTIDEIDVFTLQDNYSNPSEPTESMTFSQYGLVDFQVQYWNGLGWVTVSGGSVTGNNKVWKKINFSQVTTSKIRVNVTSALANYSRVTEVEAWGPGVGINYTYDAAGNVTNDGLHSYTYDAENRVVSVDGGVTAQYKYDHQNRRVTRTVGSTWTHYIWEGAQVIGEHDATTPLPGYGQPPYQEQSARLDYVYAGAQMIRSRQRTSSTAPWVTQYYLSDRLSVRMTLDSSGNVLGRQAHLSFGAEFGESGTQEKHHLTAYERDSETGTDYAVNREYSAVADRFMSVDRYGESDRIGNAQSHNRYSYVVNDPVNMIDPMGLEEEELGTADTFQDCQHQLRRKLGNKFPTAVSVPDFFQTLHAFAAADTSGLMDIELLLTTWWYETSFVDPAPNNLTVPPSRGGPVYGPMQLQEAIAIQFQGPGQTLDIILGKRNSRTFTGDVFANVYVGARYLKFLLERVAFNAPPGVSDDNFRALAGAAYEGPGHVIGRAPGDLRGKYKRRFDVYQDALRIFHKFVKCAKRFIPDVP